MITEDPARDGLNWYAYCGGNPIRYIDPSGLARKDTEYTYTTYRTEKEVWGGKVITTSVVEQTYSMTQVQLTNLNLTVYTLDGQRFHTDPAALIRGEYLFAEHNTSNVFVSTLGGSVSTNLNGTWYMTNVRGLETMDKEQGWNNTFSWGKFTFSAVSDATMVFGFFAKAIGAAGSTGVKIVGGLDKAAGAVSYTWSGAESINNLTTTEYNSFMAFMQTVGREALGYVPIYGTYKDFVAALKTAGFTVTFNK